jgi:ketosteroid isomerase-like protein
LNDLEASFRSQIICAEVNRMSAAAQSQLEQIKLAMAATNDLFDREVFGNRNYDALDQIYTSGARILPPGAPIIAGRAAIKAFWAGMIESASAKSAVLSSLDIMPAGDSVVEIGRAVLTIQPDGQAPAQLEAKYVVYWRQEDGRWKWHVDIWNMNA